MSNGKKEILEFGPFRLQSGEALLTRSGTPVSLPPKVFDLLVYLVTNGGRLVEKDELLKALWPDSFVEEANLTVNIAALRKALGTQANGEPWIETVPKRGYRFVGEITRVAESAAPTAIPPAPVSKGKYLIAAVALLLIATAIVLYVRRPAPPDVSQHQSIAVLPFQELSPNPGDPLAGIGMTDALITKLGTLPQLTVRPVANVLKYETAGADPLAAGRALGVNTVLTGSVQRLDKRIRLSVRLLRVQDGQSLYAEKFDEFFTNVFAVQDAISEKLAHVLVLRLTSEEQERMLRRYTESTEAFRYYELGRYERSVHTELALEDFQRAIAEDPRYALPYVDLASLYMSLSGNGLESYQRYAAKSRESAEMALRLAPDLAEAHVASADVKRVIDHDFAGAARELEIAMRLNRSSAKVHISRANMLAMEGDLVVAAQEARVAVDLDPFNGQYAGDLGWILYCSRQYDVALQWLDEFKQRDPRDRVDWNRFYCYLKLSRVPEAIELMEGAIKSQGPGRAYNAVLAHAYALAGRKQEARDLLKSLGDNWGFYQRAVVDLTWGDRAAALAHLNQAVDEHTVFAPWVKVDPDFDALHGDPAFNSVIKRVGLKP